MTKPFAPMLSGECTDTAALRFPVLASPKLDGIRALVRNGVLVSRNLKPIPNMQLQVRYGNATYEGMDGELIAGDPKAPDVFRATSSVVMSRDKDAGTVQFYAFDKVPPLALTVEFHNRLAAAERVKGAAKLIVVPHVLCYDENQLKAAEEKFVSQGYEGLMLRDPNGPYKYGRSTENEGWLLKWKRFADAEGEIVGVKEQMRNGNEATVDNLGHTKRSTHKAGKAGKGVLGAFTVKVLNGPFKGAMVDVGTGFTDAQRAEYWGCTRGTAHTTRVLKFRYFPLGSKDAPRFPVFVGFRDPIDM